MAASGSNSKNIYCANSSTYPYLLSISWNENENGTSVSGNTSNITMTASLYGKNVSFADGGGTLYLDWWDNNTNSWVNKSSLRITSLNLKETKSQSVTFDISHKSDGTLTGCGRARWEKSGGSWSPATNSVQTNDIALTTIPRATNCPSISATIGVQVGIGISPASSSFKHTVRYKFGNATGTIVNKASGTTLYGTFSDKANLYAQIPNSKSGSGTLYLDTYSGSTLIGTKTNTFYLNANETEVKPNVSISSIELDSKTNELTGTTNKIISGVSSATIGYSSSSKYSSSISSTKINNVVVANGSNKTATLNNLTTNIFNLVTTDSRGYSNSTSDNSLLMIPHTKLTCNSKLYRPEPTTGEIKAEINGNFSATEFSEDTINQITVLLKYKEKGTSSNYTELSLTPTISFEDNKYNIDISLGNTFDYQKAYEFVIIVTDLIDEITQNTEVSKGKPTFGYNDEYVFIPHGKMVLNGVQIEVIEEIEEDD